MHAGWTQNGFAGRFDGSESSEDDFTRVGDTVHLKERSKSDNIM